MTLSSLFQKPAQTALISGGVTDSVITASPAILLGYHAGGIYDIPNTPFAYNYEIKNGSTSIAFGYAATGPVSYFASGIDCLSGIKASTLAATGSLSATQLSKARFSIFYTLK